MNSQPRPERSVPGPDRARTATVLHSTRAAGSETKYASHMAAVASDDVRVKFFSWRSALFGRYDIFHVHWPEGLVGEATSAKQKISYALTRVLLWRLRVQQIPVVRTLHNHVPHDAIPSKRVKRVFDKFEQLTKVEIHLVPEPGRTSNAETVYIPHGSYHVPFGAYSKPQKIPKRILFFGLLRRYKGVDDLLSTFSSIEDRDISLKIVGKPVDMEVQKLIETAIATDTRISAKFGFVPDAELVAEVSRATLVVLPYRELHSSGAALVALSLDRPVLVPSTTTTVPLRDEVGGDWVQLFNAPLAPEDLLDALRVAEEIDNSSAPDMSDRTWEKVRSRHLAVYRSLHGTH